MSHRSFRDVFGGLGGDDLLQGGREGKGNWRSGIWRSKGGVSTNHLIFLHVEPKAVLLVKHHTHFVLVCSDSFDE